MGQLCGEEPTAAGDGTGASTEVVALAPPVEFPSDFDSDGVSSFCDNCLDAPNRDQRESEADADGIGDVCDCDFNNDGFCNSDDANLFLADYQLGTDAAPKLGTDMNGDGVVDGADFALFEPGFAANAPGAARTVPPEMILNGAVPGPCWGHRVNLGGDGNSDGCSVPANRIALLELVGLPPGGDLNNPTNAKTLERTGGLVGCPNAAFATFRKPGDVCGIDVPVDVCTAARAGLPCVPGYCKGPTGADCGDCPSGTRCYPGGSGCNPDPPIACSSDSDCIDAIGPASVCEDEVRCGDLSEPRACEKHDACGAVCGYRTYACNDQFLLDMVATCNALEGLERQYCHADCMLFANAYYETVALASDQLFRDDGTWLDIDYAAEAGDCACCDDGDPPAACGDGVCEPPVETCRAPDCPEDCGDCELGDACLQDEDCPALACLPDGRCGKLPAGSECSESSHCRSGLCIVTCRALCGDGFCDGVEVCGSASLVACNADCGTCGVGQACSADSDCASSDTCLFGTCTPKLPDGSPCESNNDCQTGDCELLTCGGVKCLNDGDCSGLGAELCVLGICLPTKFPNNQPCVRNEMCESGVCNGGLCADAGSVGPNGICTTDAVCSSGSCVAGICAASCGDGTCSPVQELCGAVNSGLECSADCGKCSNGTACLSNAVCSSGVCNLGSCRAAGSVGPNGACTTNGACSSGSCVAGFCAASCGDGTCSPVQERCGAGSSGLDCNADCGQCNNGLFCNSDGDCKSGNCVLGLCVANCKIIGASCSSDGDCCSESCVDRGSILGERCD